MFLFSQMFFLLPSLINFFLSKTEKLNIVALGWWDHVK